MSLGFLDRCVFLATSTGTGDFVPASAVTGYLTPAQAGAVDGVVYRYFAQSDDLSQWEVGYGAYTVSGTTLDRGTVEFSSNSNNLVSFSAAPKVYMGGPLARDMPLLIADSSVTNVESLAIDLPAGYPAFRLELFNWQIDTSDNLAFALSSDGGSTYHNDTGVTDIAYRNMQFGGSAGAESLTSEGLGHFLKSTFNVDANTSFFADVDIHPGGTGVNARLFTKMSHNQSGGGNSIMANTASVLDEATGRMNRILIFPLGNEDIPPTSGELITQGFYRLWGIPGA